MKTKLDRKISRYLKEIQQILPNDYNGKEQIFETFQNSIYDFLEEYPDASFEDVVDEFGSVADVSSSFLETDEDILRTVRATNRHYKHIFLLKAITPIILIGIIFYAFYYARSHILYTDTELIIYDETTPEMKELMEEYNCTEMPYELHEKYFSPHERKQ